MKLSNIKIEGIVIKGFQYEDKPFKTANIKADIPIGIYSCRTNQGRGIAICEGSGVVETHILGFDKDIYGETLIVDEFKPIDCTKLLKTVSLFVTEYDDAGGQSLGLARAYIKNVPVEKQTSRHLARILREQKIDANNLIEQANAIECYLIFGNNKKMVIDAANIVLAEKTARAIQNEF